MAKKDSEKRWIGPNGEKIPPKYLDPVIKKRDKLVTKLFKKAKKLSRELEALNEEIQREVAGYITEVQAQYGIKAENQKGNKSLTDFSGTAKIEIRNRDTLDFDERLDLAKQLIDNCIRRWSQGANDRIRILVEDAFQVDKRGHLDKFRILGLQRLKLGDPEWDKAIAIINDSIRVVDQKTYLNVYEKDGSGKFVRVGMDLNKF